ncbi:MAG TPA: glycosyltransferase [Pyrinomonadaceae bacterium]|jgi:glycosyltransferase involved in cell wall biosynthesis|nr:glycosyltransferase [Pyrinomonadaceae bacterium]
MPTRNRRRFVGQAVWYFQRQDYPHKELIVLDDGEDSVADLIPADERIRYVRLDRPLALGAKRNLGCELSRGELIAHWDDDDWMAPHRLSFQVEQLLMSGADVCGARQLLFYRPSAGEAWLYCYPHEARPWLAGGTLLYRRATWETHRFPEINIGEDNAFIWRLPPESLHAVADSSFYVALIHSGNTSAKNLADPRWHKRLLNEISGLFALDSDFYAALRNGHAVVPRKSNPPFYAASAQANENGSHKRCDSLAICASEAEELPLVSCIMPTYNRRPFLSQAIEYFKRQDYPRRELIIVDDGTDAIGKLIPRDPSIRYIHLPDKRSIGAKRNRACEAARGQLIILWDDDDWYADDRISYQVAPLVAGSADVTALGNGLFYYLPTRQFWACTSQLHARMFYQGIVGGTLAFRKSLWGEKVRFPNISEREDAVFLEMMLKRGARLEKLSNDGVFVYIRHEANTWRFTLGTFLDNGWRQVSPPQFLSEQDCKFYGIARPKAPDAQGRTAARNQPARAAAPEPPLVSCILTTGNRMPFLKQAIKYFQNQTYANKELIVVDDGLEPAEALIPEDERIKYLRLDGHVPLGTKLNIGIENSRGEIIQKLDDDDYYHPRFLEATVGALSGHDPLDFIVGFGCFLVFIVSTGELKFSGQGWCAGQTLCFYRQLWEKKPFRDVPMAVDALFLEDHPVQQIRIEEPELFITVRHEAGHLWTTMGQLDVTEYFKRQPNYSKSLAECVSAENLAFYERLRDDFSQSETESVGQTTDAHLTALNLAT